MKHVVIVSGGNVEDAFACKVIEQEQPDVLLAADAGMEFFYRNGMKPRGIIGDFDSTGSEALAYFREQPDVWIRELNPVKDDTDTEAVIRLALREGAEKITVLGGTGSRLDHVLGNIELLGIGLEHGVEIQLLDSHNRIRMIQQGIHIRKSEQFGTYVSLIPYTGVVEHLFLRGFKYPLEDACLKGFCSLGVSNEIIEEEATIEFERGILLVIESKD